MANFYIRVIVCHLLHSFHKLFISLKGKRRAAKRNYNFPLTFEVVCEAFKPNHQINSIHYGYFILLNLILSLIYIQNQRVFGDFYSSCRSALEDNLRRDSTPEDTLDACIRDHDLTGPSFFVNGAVQNFGLCLNYFVLILIFIVTYLQRL